VGRFCIIPRGIGAVFFTAVASAMKSVCARRKFLGGDTGFIAILHTWTRQMLFHPMCSSRAVALAQSGCELIPAGADAANLKCWRINDGRSAIKNLSREVVSKGYAIAFNKFSLQGGMALVSFGAPAKFLKGFWAAVRIRVKNPVDLFVSRYFAPV
jgi:hypothetical protein